MTRKKEYVVELTQDERSMLEKMISSGKHGARKITRARVLLKADQGEHGPSWIDRQISEALEIGTATIERIRKKIVEQGLEAAINRKKHHLMKPRSKLDGHQEAKLIQIACTEAPEGNKRWTLNLLADKLVELNVVDSISYRTVGRVLKKQNLNLGKKNRG